VFISFYFKIFAALFILLSFSLVSRSQSNIATKQTPNAISIVNTGHRNLIVKPRWSQGFWESDKQLIKFINTNYSNTDLKFDYQKAWAFICDYSWDAVNPLVHENVNNSILGFVNSEGWGLCDDKANILAKIWKRMGYDARLYGIGGHVVPEIWVNGRWEMWDPTYRTYYVNEKGDVLGVAELEKNPHYITKPIKKIRGNVMILRHVANSKKTAAQFSSADNNQIFDFSMERNDSVFHNILVIPAGAEIVFPYYSGLPIYSISDNKKSNQVRYTNLMLSLPPGYTGYISYPLIFHGFSSVSAVEVAINGTPVECRKNLEYYETNFGVKTIQIKHNPDGVNLFFLVNPRIVNPAVNDTSFNIGLKSSEIIVSRIHIKGKHNPEFPFIDENPVVFLLKTLRLYCRNHH